jgi:TRAP-type C4-dicarboxylate transport system permease small subunit
MFCFDAASHFLRGPWLRAARSLAHAFACAACAALSSAAWTFFQEEWRAGGTLFSVMGLNVPQWTFVLVVPAGFCLLCLHHGIRAAASAAAPRP